MQLNKRKKFLVMIMFSMGFFVTVVSVIRLQQLLQFGKADNFTCESFLPNVLEHVPQSYGFFQITTPLLATGPSSSSTPLLSAPACLLSGT
jgi:hypothetical protein